MLDATIRQPKATRPILALGLLVWLTLASVPTGGQTITPANGEAIDWKWALTQGGLTLVVLVLGWSYRKDWQKWAEEKVALTEQLAEAKSAYLDEKIAFQQARVDEALRYNRNLETLTQRTNETLKATADAITAHTMAMTLNTEGAKRLAHVVERLDQRMERVEHGGK